MAVYPPPKSKVPTAASLQTQVEQLRATLDTATKPGYVSKGVPAVRVGEDPMSSRPFYISRVAEALTSKSFAKAKLESAMSGQLKKALEDYNPQHAYAADSVLLPLSWDLLPDDIRLSSDFTPMKKAMAAAMPYDEMATSRVLKKAPQSFVDPTQGGYLVRPPEYGELIQLLRNKSALTRIGALQIALPAQGSIQFPRQTSASVAQQYPEVIVAQPGSTGLTFDDMTLQAKTFMAFVPVTNLLLRNSEGTAEQIIRNDLLAQIGLNFDKAGLEGSGGPGRVLGVVNTPGINLVTATGAATNGDVWAPKDMTRMIAAAQAQNSDILKWIMRPDYYLGMTEYRASGGAVPGDGGYLYDLLRKQEDNIPDKFKGRDVITSNNVSNTRTKGSASNLTYVLGVDPQAIVLALHGAVEITLNTQADSVFYKNQSVLRVVMYGDVGVRQPAAVTLMDTLIPLTI